MRRCSVVILLSLVLVALGVQVAAVRLNQQLCRPAAVTCDVSLRKEGLLLELLGSRYTFDLPAVDPGTEERARALGEAVVSFIDRANDRLSESADTVRRALNEHIGIGQGAPEKTGQ